MSTNGSTPPDFPTQSLNDEQVNALVTVSTESPATQDLADVVKIILETGLRTGELRDLRWADADTFIDADKTWGRFSVKGKQTARQVFFGPAPLKVLSERRERHPDSAFVFGELRKGCIKRVSRQLSSLAPQIGVSRLTLQTLRHTFFTRLANAGASMIVIKHIGGWKSWGSVTPFFTVSDPVLKREYDAAMKRVIE